MSTAATYKTKDFYFGRTLDNEFSFGETVTVTPRNFPPSPPKIPRSYERGIFLSVAKAMVYHHA